ncbi:MAG: DUF3300 domain-containing protein [Opitutus sp.]|nr:DUF3300 domain-containing protein [Opitutus sp.]
MKTSRVSLVLLLLIGAVVRAQDPVPVTRAPAVEIRRTPQEIERLVAPIALYPDALIALILPAATSPADVVLAARHVREFPGDSSQIEHRAWDESVKSLTHYPEVLKWMDENLPWTKQVGEVFAEQPADVMQAIQRLRAKARAAGTLVDTPQQQVISDADVLRIVPGQPEIIYVPYYEPEVVFAERPVYYPHSFLTFGAGVSVGSWLAFDFDWRRHAIFAGNRHRPWTGHDWRRPLVPIAPITVVYTRPAGVRQWRPPPRPPQPAVGVAWRGSAPIARPSPIGTSGAPSFAPRPPIVESRSGDDHSVQRVFPPHRPPPPGTRAFAGTGQNGVVPNSAISVPTPTVPTQVSADPSPTASAPAPVRRTGPRGERNRDREPRPHPEPSPMNQATSAAAVPPVPQVVRSQPKPTPAPAAPTPSRPSVRPAPSTAPQSNPAPATSTATTSSRSNAPAPAAAATPRTAPASPAPTPAATTPRTAPASPAPARTETTSRGRNENEKER